MEKKINKILTEEEIAMLLEVAVNVSKNAYAPFSNFKVGAALLTDSGEIFSGCNVENSSYGLTVCAERNAVGNAVSSGYKKFKAILIFCETEKSTPPCGACRQVLSEFVSEDFIIILANKNKDLDFYTIKDLLPNPFKLK